MACAEAKAAEVQELSAKVNKLELTIELHTGIKVHGYDKRLWPHSCHYLRPEQQQVARSAIMFSIVSITDISNTLLRVEEDTLAYHALGSSNEDNTSPVTGWAGKMLTAYTSWSRRRTEHHKAKVEDIKYPCGNAVCEQMCTKGHAHGAHMGFVQFQKLPTTRVYVVLICGSGGLDSHSRQAHGADIVFVQFQKLSTTRVYVVLVCGSGNAVRRARLVDRQLEDVLTGRQARRGGRYAALHQ